MEIKLQDDELTEKMHSEFTISSETEIKHRAGCVWILLGYDAPAEEVAREAKAYGITYDDAMKWKQFFKDLQSDKTF